MKRSATTACEHPGFFGKMCAVCGSHKTDDDEVVARYCRQDFELSQKECDRQAQQTLEQHKLVLVLDLDHTLLNSARFSELTDGDMSCLDTAYNKQHQQQQQQQQQALLHKIDELQLWTKIRPSAHEFLEQASHMFDMYVYTMGERRYAEAMVHLLDPTGKLFKGQVISRNDSTDGCSKGLDMVLGQESIALIVDDTLEVWPEEQREQNLICVNRYHYFAASAKQFGMPEESSLQSRTIDESRSRGTLANLLQGLREVHTAFFEDDFWFLRDVRDVSSELRAKYLENNSCKRRKLAGN